MKKLIKFLTLLGVLFTLLWAAPLPAAAQTPEQGEEQQYGELAEQSGLLNLGQELPQEVLQALQELEVDLKDPQSLFRVDFGKVGQLVLLALQSGLTQPLRATAVTVALFIVTAAANGLFLEGQGRSPAIFLLFAATVLAFRPLFGLVQTCGGAIRAVAAFGLAVVPVLCTLLIALGKTATASAAAGLLTAACEGVSQAVAYLFVPLTGGCLCLSVCSAVTPIAGLQKLVGTVRSVCVKGMGLLLALFETVLSLQTVVTAKGESLGVKAAQMLAGSSLPVLGGAVSGALSTAAGFISIMGSSAGVYVLLVLLLLLLPTVAQLLCWRLGLWLCGLTAGLLGQDAITPLFTMLDYCLSVMLGALLLVGLLVFLSVGVVLKTGVAA